MTADDSSSDCDTNTIIMLVLMTLMKMERPRITASFDRLLRAVSNFHLAVLEDEFDEWIEMHDGFDWVTLTVIAPEARMIRSIEKRGKL